ncbi:E3 ubiquitin-protein ligase rad18 [Microbotryomycetes sp. JL221]|nr:E3 ubiquitin-protein ligase rad18 [Microbotryomycetes sp. JL221]
MRCNICGELYMAPVMLTTCSHTFCSLCLRESLQYKKVCPTCNVGADEGRIRTNSTVDAIVKAWAAARRPLLDLQAIPAHSKTSSGKQDQTTRTKRPGSAQQDGHNNDDRDDDSDIEILNSVAITSTRRTRSSKAKVISEDDSVECPICQGRFPNPQAVGIHIDSCTGIKPSRHSSKAWGTLMGGSNKKGSKSRDNSEPEEDTTKPLPLSGYSTMNVQTLTKALKSFGLPTSFPTGASSNAKLALYRRRLQYWTTLWNANADVDVKDSRHKSRARLVKDLIEWEKTNQYSNEVEIESVKEAQAYTRAHANDFKSLIEKARSSFNVKREPVSLPPPIADATEEGDDTEIRSFENDESDEMRPMMEDQSVTVVNKTVKPRRPVRFATPDKNERREDTMVNVDAKNGPATSSVLSDTSSPVMSFVRITSDDDMSEPSPPRWLEHPKASQVDQSVIARGKKRSPSPFDARGPRPSQRIRGEALLIDDDEELEGSERDDTSTRE